MQKQGKRKVNNFLSKESKKILEALYRNSDLAVSFVSQWSRQPGMSIHEQRLLFRIMESSQDARKGILDNGAGRTIERTGEFVKLTMPLRDAFFSNLTLKQIREVLTSLMSRVFEWYDVENAAWKISNFITKAVILENEPVMSFCVADDLWSMYGDLSKGVTTIELKKALELESAISMRFYMLVSGRTEPIRMTIEQFRRWVGIPTSQYRDKDGKDRIDHIEEKVIRPAKAELDSCYPYSFSYEKIRENPDTKRGKVAGFVFFPLYQSKFRDSDLARKAICGQGCL